MQMSALHPPTYMWGSVPPSLRGDPGILAVLSSGWEVSLRPPWPPSTEPLPRSPSPSTR